MARGSQVLVVAAAGFGLVWWLLYPAARSSFVRPLRGKEWAFVRQPRHFFVFGDSYSSEGWDWKRVTNPLDPYPIQTNSDGPMWARNLTRRWPDSRLINLAVDGATVDNNVIGDKPLRRMDLQGQVAAFERYFLNGHLPWNATNAVAALEFGTNDVGMSFLRIPDLNKAYDAVGAAYVSAVKRLHAAGLRAFVFSLVLPVHRADMGRGKPYEESLKHAARLFNAVVVRGAVQRWCAAAKDVLCVVLDTYELADVVMDYPDVYGFTRPYGYCQAYAARKNAEPDLDVHPTCDGPLREYVWRDSVHPSYAFHELWADLYEDTLALMVRFS